MDYFIISAFILLSTWIFYRFTRDRRIVTFIGLFLLILLVCAFRQVIPNIDNSDAYVYKRFYERAFNKSIGEYFLSIETTEFIFYGYFWLCAKFNFSYTLVRAIYYFVMLLMVIEIINEIEARKNNYFDFIFLFSNFVLANCLMRNCIAYVIGWLAITKALNKKYIQAFLLATIGIFVHNSCIIVLVSLIFIIGIQIIKDIRLLFLFMFGLYGGLIYIMPLIMSILGATNEKVAYYMDINTGSFAITTNLIRIIIILLLLFLYNEKKQFRSDCDYKNLMILCLFSLSIVFIQLVNGIAYRFLAYFDIIHMLSFGYIRTSVHKRRITASGYEITGILLSIISMIVFIIFIDSSLTGYGLIPIRW